MSLLALAGTNSATGGYDIDNSLKFESDNSERLTRTHSSTTNRRTWTVSAWVKRTELDSLQTIISGGKLNDATGVTTLQFNADNTLIFYTHPNHLTTTRVFRDTSAWYHIVWAVDSTQATAADRVNVYINGVQETSFSTENYPTQNWDSAFNYAIYDTNIGRYAYDNARYFNGYMTDINFIDGSQLAPTEFGEFDDDTGIWKPKKYTGTYGTNGFYLDFESSGSLGADVSGNGNNFTLNNITSADQATDTPTNNFTTFNILRRYNQGRISFTEGGTVVNTASGNAWTTVFNTMAVNKGKWYWEGELYAGNGYQMFGQTPQPWTEININIDWYLGQRSDKQNGAGYYGSGADVYYEGGYVDSSANATGDIISVAMDCDNNKVHFAVNGVYTNSSNPVNNTNGFAMLDDYQYFAMATYIGSYAFKANFGGFTTISISTPETDENGYGTFEYAPPSGYYALCTKNLEEFG